MYKYLYSLLLIVISILPISLFACSCAEQNILEDWNKHHTVALVETVSSNILEKSQGDHNQGKIEVSFNLLNVYKGNPELITHLTAVEQSNGYSCDISIGLHSKYIIFFNNTAGPANISLCSPTKKIAHYNEYILEVIDLIKNKVRPTIFKGIYDKKSGMFITGDFKQEIFYYIHEESESEQLAVELEAFKTTNGLHITNIVSIKEINK